MSDDDQPDAQNRSPAPDAAPADNPEPDPGAAVSDQGIGQRDDQDAGDSDT